jgi:hypothetical protein
MSTLHTYGDVRRRDGMRFVQYRKNRAGTGCIETWLSAEAWDRNNTRRLQRNREYKQRKRKENK